MEGQTGRSDSAGPGRLLIVKTSSIGDVIHALPIAAIIKQRFPAASVGWVVRQRCAALLDGNPSIDRTYVIPDRPSFTDLMNLRNNLRGDRYDVALDLQGLLFSGVVTWLSGAHRRIGLDLNREGNRIFLTEPTVPARRERDRHAIDILRGFLPTIGIDADAPWPKLAYLADAERPPEELAAAERRAGLVALNVGASSIYKQWPVEYWTQLARELADSDFTPVLIGGPTDVDAAASVRANAGLGERLIDLAGRTSLLGLASVLASCDILVSADTGPLHIASGIGTPVIALFGPTNPARTGPYGDRTVVLWKRLECSPCFRKPTCNGRVDCMKAIAAGEVLLAVKRILKEFAPC